MDLGLGELLVIILVIVLVWPLFGFWIWSGLFIGLCLVIGLSPGLGHVLVLIFILVLVVDFVSV